MSPITVIVLLFSLLGAADYLLGNRLGLGKEFEKAFSLFCPMALSMIGMLVLAPAIGVWLTPLFDGFYQLFHIDPSIIPASLFANDMGGMSLSQAVGKDPALANYNAFVISSMMGCVISFTIPFSLGLVRKEQHRDLFLGLLCGIVTIPTGSIVAGLMCGINPVALLRDLLPLVLLSLIVGGALLWFPQGCIKAFSVFGAGIKTLSILGFVCAIVTFLTKKPLSPHFDSLESAALVCVSACVTLSGMLPAMSVLARVLNRPLTRLGNLLGINGVSALAFLGSMVTNATTFGIMDRMDRRGTVLNAAFSVSASFVFGSHMAFTMAFDHGYVVPMVVAKLISGLCAVTLALLIYRGDPQTSEAAVET